jgi:hypothetical protein
MPRSIIKLQHVVLCIHKLFLESGILQVRCKPGILLVRKSGKGN